MEFTLVTAEKLKVRMSAGEMDALGLSYEHLDYTDPASRRMLVSLLEEGRDKTGFNPKKSRLFIQVFPSEDGGCVICFTCLRSGQSPPGAGAPGPEAVIFAFDDIETLLEASVKTHIHYGHRIYKSSLYRLGRGYRLVVYPLDYADRLSVLFLGEFTAPAGEGGIAAAYVEEHGELLIGDTALDTLARYFG